LKGRRWRREKGDKRSGKRRRERRKRKEDYFHYI